MITIKIYVWPCKIRKNCHKPKSNVAATAAIEIVAQHKYGCWNGQKFTSRTIIIHQFRVHGHKRAYTHLEYMLLLFVFLDIRNLERFATLIYAFVWDVCVCGGGEGTGRERQTPRKATRWMQISNNKNGNLKYTLCSDVFDNKVALAFARMFMCVSHTQTLSAMPYSDLLLLLLLLCGSLVFSSTFSSFSHSLSVLNLLCKLA